MKKKIRLLCGLIAILLFTATTVCTAQNLVPNGSFETYTSCPTGNSGIDLAVPWHSPPGSGTTPDYMNSCQSGALMCSNVDVPDNFIGTAPAMDGNAYAAILFTYDLCLDCREYIQVQLTSPLVAGTEYLVYMYIRPGDYNRYMTNNQAIFISDFPISQPSNQPITGVTPQFEHAGVIGDTSKWTYVGGTYVALGGEEYITIGNFHDNAGTNIHLTNYPGGNCALVTEGSMYMIDSVYVGNSNMAPLAAFGAGDSAICQMNCLDFSDSSANSPTSWQWSFPGATPNFSTDQNPSNICYAVPGFYDVTLIVTNAAGSDTITLSNFINVNALPTASITQSNDTLFASAGFSYQWFTGGVSIPGATDFFYVPSAESLYSVVITDSNGCSASDTLFFSLAPQVSFAASDISVCQKFCLDFTDVSGNNPTQWAWSFEGGIPAVSALQNPAHICYDQAGTYDVTLIASNGFGSDTLLLSDYITVYATPPFPVISQNGFTLTSSAAVSYQWLLNSVDIPGATNQSYQVLQAGLYTVVISDSNGCVNASSLEISISGVNDLNGNDGFPVVYPNPSDGHFTITYSGVNKEKDWTLEFINALGAKCFTVVQKGATAWRQEVDLSKEAAGIYFLVMSSGDRRMLQKLVIEQ